MEKRYQLNNKENEALKNDNFLNLVEFQIHPPVSYKISSKSKKVGSLIFKSMFKQGDSLEDLLNSLHDENPDSWEKLYDIKKKKMRPPIRTLLNGKALSPTVFAHTSLSNGDKISFVVLYGGG